MREKRREGPKDPWKTKTRPSAGFFYWRAARDVSGCNGVCAKKRSADAGEQGALRRAGRGGGAPRQPGTNGEGMGQKKSNLPGRDEEGHFLPRATAGASRTGSKKKKSGPKKKLSPRAKVKKAQLNVIEKVEKILSGNCASATNGNYKCAEFVLDWSGASDLRTPLAKEKKKSLIAGLLKLAQKQQGEAKKEEAAEE